MANKWIRGKNFFNFFYYLFKKSLKDNLLLYAQGLTYNTLLTLIPILGLIISLGRSFLNEDMVIQQSFIFLANYLNADALITVMDRIVKLIENLKGLPLGRFSLLFYFLMSLGLLFQLEDVLNHIFLSFKRRTFKERVLFYWIVLSFAPFIFFLPLLLQTSLKGYFNYKLVVYFLFLWLFFYLLYIYFPARRVSKLAALKGALFTTLLWYLFSFLFGFYVKKAVAYSKLYGSLSVLPIFLLFLFLNWLIFLIGAEITYLLEKRFLKKKIIPFSYPGGLILLLSYIGEKFYQGESVLLKDLERELPYSEENLLRAIKELVERNYIKVKDEEIFLKIPLEKIKILDLLAEEDLKILFHTYILSKNKDLEDLYPKLEEILNKSLKDLISLKIQD